MGSRRWHGTSSCTRARSPRRVTTWGGERRARPGGAGGTRIDDESFGIPEAGFPIQETRQVLGPNPNRRPFICENGTYRIVSAVFDVTQRSSSTVPRPLPYTPAFASAFPTIITFVGTLEGTVTNEAGEQFRLLMTDLAHEVMTPTSFSSTNPIHAFFVDADGRIRDRASLVGRVNIDRTTGPAVHKSWIPAPATRRRT